MEHYRRIILCVDVMKINKMPFLVTISRAIKFGTVAWLKNAKKDTILKHLTDVRNIYKKRGFLLEVIEADGQFGPLETDLASMGITLNKCSREEHVPVAERRIRTLKERCRCIFNTMPFNKLPGMLIVQMVSTCNFWLNIFPPTDGVSRNINPRELITGVKIDFNKHIKAEFGEYVQVHEEHDNSMKTRTTGALATKPTGNAQGGHWFYSLTTGRMLDRKQWTSLPMPNDVPARIHRLPKSSHVGMNFTNILNEEYDDNGHDDGSESDEDSDYDSDDDSTNGDDDDYDNYIAGVDTNDTDPSDPPAVHGDANNNNNNENNDGIPETDHEDEPAMETDADNDVDEPDKVTVTEDATDEPPDNVPPPTIPSHLNNLTDDTGILPPTIQSRTRQQAQQNGESLLNESDEWETIQKTDTKRQRRFKRHL